MIVVGLGGNDGDDAAPSCRRSIGLAGVAFVADARTRFDIGTKAEQNRKVGRIALLAAGQVEGDGMTVEVCF